jgi:hypothetical protein
MEDPCPRVTDGHVVYIFVGVHWFSVFIRYTGENRSSECIDSVVIAYFKLWIISRE